MHAHIDKHSPWGHDGVCKDDNYMIYSKCILSIGLVLNNERSIFRDCFAINIFCRWSICGVFFASSYLYPRVVLLLLSYPT